MRQLFYYKIRQKFITKCVRIFITKCDVYYKLQQYIVPIFVVAIFLQKSILFFPEIINIY